MAAKVVEKHVLTGTPFVEVDIWDNGEVDVVIGEEAVPARRLAEIVAFVEAHGQVTVSVHDD